MVTATVLTETLTKPLDGLTEAFVKLSFGGGELTLHRAIPGMLLSGTFVGGVRDKSTASDHIDLEPLDIPRNVLAGCKIEWNVALTAEIPVDLRLDTGANHSTIDVSALQIRRLELHTGASETVLRLPAHGATPVLIECGFAQVTAEVPIGVAARIHGGMGLGAVEVDEARFPRIAGGWESPEYATSADRVDIEVKGGFGTVRVR